MCIRLQIGESAAYDEQATVVSLLKPHSGVPLVRRHSTLFIDTERKVCYIEICHYPQGRKANNRQTFISRDKKSGTHKRCLTKNISAVILFVDFFS